MTKTSAEGPDAESKNLFHFFDEHWYVVPPYQRNYAWTRVEVGELLSDIQSFVERDDSYYLLGQVIVAPAENRNEDYELVDGQQRCTTLMLLFISLWNNFPEGLKKNSPEEDLKNRLHSMIRINKLKRQGWRVTTVGNGPTVISELFSGDAPDEDEDDGSGSAPLDDDPTSMNIRVAYEQIDAFVKENWVATDSVAEVVDALQSRVWLTRLVVEGRAQAVAMYERINNRGLDLDGSDLIKNLLFASIPDDEFDDVSANWAAASKSLEINNKKIPKKLRSMQYLLRAELIGRVGRKVTDDEVYREWDELLTVDPTKTKIDPKTKRRTTVRLSDKKITDNALGLADELDGMAKSLNRIAQQKRPSDGVELNQRASSSHFGSIQHYPVLLAGAHLPAKTYEELERRVESRIVLGWLAKERNQDLEKIIPSWAANVKKLGAKATSKDLDSASVEIAKDLPALLNEAMDTFVRLTYGVSGSKERIRTVLGIGDVFLQSQLRPKSMVELPRILTSPRAASGKKVPALGFDLDHVFSQKGYAGHPLLHSVGNLALTDVAQRGKGDLPPQKKVDQIYASSDLLLTRGLAPVSKLGGLTKAQREFFDDLHGEYEADAMDWGTLGILERIRMYWDFFAVAMNDQWAAIPDTKMPVQKIQTYLEEIELDRVYRAELKKSPYT